METIKVKDLGLWEAFLWTARKKQFTGAASVLRCNTAQVSKRVSQLEKMLELRLFNRTTRNVSLTREGQDLLPKAELLIESVIRIENKKFEEREPAGRIKVACLPSFAIRCLAPSLSKFHSQYPKLEVEIDASEGIVDLVERGIDVALRVQTPKGAQFVFRKLLENKIILVASPKYIKSIEGRMPKNPGELKGHPLLTLELFSELRFKKSGIRLHQLQSPRPIRCESGSMITELCLQGAGIAVRSAWDAGPLIREGKLVRVLPNHPLESFGNLYAVTPHRELIPDRVRVCLNHVLISAEKWRLDGEV